MKLLRTYCSSNCAGLTCSTTASPVSGITLWNNKINLINIDYTLTSFTRSFYLTPFDTLTRLITLSYSLSLSLSRSLYISHCLSLSLSLYFSLSVFLYHVYLPPIRHYHPTLIPSLISSHLWCPAVDDHALLHFVFQVARCPVAIIARVTCVG